VLPDPSQQVPGLFVAPNRGVVPRTVGQHFDEEDEQNRWDALECEEKAPADVGVAVVDEGEAEGEPIGYGDSEVCDG
jgi:hypothetical protein